MRALFHGDYIGSDRSALHGRVKSPTRPRERASHLALTRQNCYLSAKMNLPKNIPKDLSDLLQAMATDFPRILRGNLVGVYLWGSLTYGAFDDSCSDVDCLGVTRRDLDDREFSELDAWLKQTEEQNRWVKRIARTFAIALEFLAQSRHCSASSP